jgi:non-ribosomal peptide synthetase component F
MQVLFQFLPETTAAELQLPWGQARSSQFMAEGWERETCHMDLAFEVHGRCISATYSTELFNTSTIHSMLQSFLQLLQQLVDSPQKSVMCANLLDSTGQQTVLQWGGGQQQARHLQAPLAHESFAAAAAATPDSCCLVFEGSSLSYGEVEHRALGLAGKLQAAGVGPGVAVGVLLERSLELPIAVLAVFMAGGCYVPLDPSYPEQRLQGYLEDSGSKLLLTTSQLSQLAADATKSAASVKV